MPRAPKTPAATAAAPMTKKEKKACKQIAVLIKEYARLTLKRSKAESKLDKLSVTPDVLNRLLKVDKPRAKDVAKVMGFAA